MAFTCDQCGRRRGGRAVTTITGREVCPSCDRDTQSMAAGMIAGQALGTSPVGSAIATVGWRDRVRRAVRSRRLR